MNDVFKIRNVNIVLEIILHLQQEMLNLFNMVQTH